MSAWFSRMTSIWHATRFETTPRSKRGPASRPVGDSGSDERVRGGRVSAIGPMSWSAVFLLRSTLSELVRGCYPYLYDKRVVCARGGFQIPPNSIVVVNLAGCGDKDLGIF